MPQTQLPLLQVCFTVCRKTPCGPAHTAIFGCRSGPWPRWRVYVGGRRVADTKVTQLSIGLQAGAQAYSQIIFFEDKRAFDEFASGSFEFGATATAVAITAGVSASAGTTGAGAGASGGKHDASTTSIGAFHKGMAVFTVAKGGLMYEASIGGQKFSYTAR